MQELDLHGYYHDDAWVAIEDFILTANLPGRVITGNSPKMRNMLRDVVGSYGMELFQDNPSNFGSFVVLEIVLFIMYRIKRKRLLS